MIIEELEEERVEEIFKDLREDFKQAEAAKVYIDKLIIEWNDLYYGKNNTYEKDIDFVDPEAVVNYKKKNIPNRSKTVMREIAKKIEWQKPNIVEPFVSTNTPIEITCPKNEERARKLEKWANNEFTTTFDRQEFVTQATDVMLREGTVWTQTSWENDRIVEDEYFEGITMDEILADKREVQRIDQAREDTFNVTFKKVIVNKNNPDTIVLRNENAFPDPKARTMSELMFFCIRKKMSISDLKKMGVEQDVLDRIDSNKQPNYSQSSLGQIRDMDDRDYGFKQDSQSNDKQRRIVDVIEYWGFYDIDGDGIVEPIKAQWIERENINITLIENPMPDKQIPIDRDVYSARPFSLWGNPPAFFLGENQKIKNGIMRGILDNMSLANNGQKFIMRGTLDYLNFKKMNNNERYIITNKADGIQDGAFNQLPGSVFDLYRLVSEESEELMGVSKNTPALTNSSTDKNGAQQQLTMSQQRMNATVRSMSNMLRKIIARWISMAEVFLDDEQIAMLFDENELKDMNVFQSGNTSKIQITVGTEANRNIKLQQLNMLMQQSKVLENNLPPEILNSLVAEMFDLFDMHEKANNLRSFVPQPSQEQIMMQQLEIENKTLENEKIRMETGLMNKDVEARYMNAQARMMEANANYGYKQAQSAEKIAKTESHRMDTALKPVQAENEIAKTKQNKEKTE